MTFSTTTIDDNTINHIHLLKRFISLVGIDTADIIDKYVGQVFTHGYPKQRVFKEFIAGAISDETLEALDEECSDQSLASFRDRRNAVTYASELIIGWILEDALFLMLEDSGYHPKMTGTDSNRQFLASQSISSVSDFVVVIDGEQRNLEVVSDFGNHWKRNDICDLRHKKADDAGVILGISMQKPSYFVVDTKSKTGDVVISNSVWHEKWGKPVRQLSGISKAMKSLSKSAPLTLK